MQAYLTADQSVPANLVYTVLQLGTVDIDTDGWYDNTTFRFTPQVAGNWFFTAQGQFSFGAALFTGIIRIRKNGTQYAASRNNVSTGGLSAGATVSLACFVAMNGTTDYVDFQAGQNQGVTVNIQGGGAPRLTFITGQLYA